ncbi:hypothetical protein MHY87_15110 [Microvirga sp. ACRRW]|uniref:hypothetical protein n=1 Tax=Microvirga sp. ACRRW TaxID=2918205 RepID=UPI001EF4CE18|nr:hypothetical protein [Microvirga sp. ACRRW]MCG7394234.1 hypothetical protein [Microvirga sp. ACRRW]
MTEFSSTVYVNSIFWITALKPEDMGATNRIYDDLIHYLPSVGIPFNTFEVSTAGDFLLALDTIAESARGGLKPILHLDAHGSNDKGILIAGSGEYVSWNAVFDKLRAINIVTGNNLCVISSACFSMQIARRIEAPVAAPFFLLVASDKEVSVGFIDDKMTAFYKEVFDGGNLVEAYRKYLSSDLTLFHCERLLAIAIAKLWADLVGQAGDRTREDMLTNAFKEGIPNTRYFRRMGRRIIKKMARPSQDFIDSQVARFLMGKPVGFDKNSLMKMIREEQGK